MQQPLPNAISMIHVTAPHLRHDSHTHLILLQTDAAPLLITLAVTILHPDRTLPYTVRQCVELLFGETHRLDCWADWRSDGMCWQPSVGEAQVDELHHSRVGGAVAAAVLQSAPLWSAELV